jgi:hypothetical protein
VRLVQKPLRSSRVGDDERELREKWKIVHGRKERLTYTTERLALEIEQKVSTLKSVINLRNANYECL